MNVRATYSVSRTCDPDEIRGIAVNPHGEIYAADSTLHVMLKYTAASPQPVVIGREGSGIGQFESPSGLALDKQGDLYVADTGNNRIQKMTATR